MNFSQINTDCDYNVVGEADGHFRFPTKKHVSKREAGRAIDA